MTVSSTTSGPNATMTWGSIPSTIQSGGLTFSFNHTTWTFAGGSDNQSSNFASGTGSVTISPGYSTTYSGGVYSVYSRSGHADITNYEGGTSGTTGPQPVTNKSAGLSVYSDRFANLSLYYNASCTGGGVNAVDRYFDGSFQATTSYNTNNISDSFAEGNGGYSTSHTANIVAYFTDGSSLSASGGTSTPGPVASFSGTSSGPYVVLNWSASGSTQITSYTVNGSSVATSGQSGSASVYVGYSTPWTASLTDNYSGYGNPYSASGTTVAAPPAPPSAVTLSGSINTSAKAVLTWTPPSSATGYRVYRNGVLLNSTASTPFVDTTTPTTRPLSYYITPYNSSAGGTTDGPNSNVVTFGAIPASAGVLIG